MNTIKIIGLTADGKSFTSVWSHRILADKVEQFLKLKHSKIVVYQVISNEGN